MIAEVLVSIVVGIVLVGVVQVFKNRNKAADLQKRLSNFKAVPAVPVMGLLLHFKDTSPEGIFKTMIGFNSKYGKNLVMQMMFNRPLLQVSEPKVIEQVLNAKTIEKPTMYDFMKEWIGDGLVVATGQRWVKHRKMITPTFHFKILEDFLVIMNKQADILMTKLAAHVNSGVDIDVYPQVGYCALDIISESAMGVQLNAQTHPQSDYVTALNEMAEIFMQRLISWDRDFKWIYRFKAMAKRQRQLTDILTAFTDSVIQQRLKQLEDAQLHPQASALAEKDSDLYGKRKVSLMDMLLSSSVDGQPLSNTHIREEVDTFMAAGHDTTTSCVSFAVYHLSHNPTVQQKVYEEIASVIGPDADRIELTNGMLQELRYLDMTVKEVLRVSPSAPVIGRKSAGDMVIDGVTLPKGMEVVVSIISMHMDPDVYPEPERFDPERFSEENQAKRQPYTYLPFSAGARNCIGQRYAMMEAKTVLVKLLANFKLLPCDPANTLRVKSDITMKPANGAFVKLVSRK